MGDDKIDRFQRNLTPGTFFGEIALVFGCNRTATVKSKTYCTLAKLDDDAFDEINLHFPELKDKLQEFVQN